LQPLKNLLNKKSEIEAKINYSFKNEKIFSQIFIHKSFYNENLHLSVMHNERLEFLGDAVLGLIVSDLLFELLPDVDEGVLSLHLSNLVNAKFCLTYFQKLKLQEYLILGRGELKIPSRGMQTILADAFEALIAGVYLDSNLSIVKNFFYENFKQDVINYIESPQRNYKAELQDYSQKKYQTHPIYKVVDERGPAHEKIFTVEVYLDARASGLGKGCPKKQAEQMAAKNALGKLKEKQ